MRFDVGDKVVYPGLGAGRVVGTEDRELVAGFQHYYVLRLPATDATVYLPVQRAADVGLRPAMSPDHLTRVLRILSSPPQEPPEDQQARQEAVQAAIRSGAPDRIAALVRDFSWAARAGDLRKRDADLLDQAMTLLAAEVALVIGVELVEARRRLEQILRGAQTPLGDSPP